MIGHVYKVRTDWSSPAPHCAEKGSLVLIKFRWPGGDYCGQAVSCGTKTPILMTFRPCDLKRLEYHEEINQ